MTRRVLVTIVVIVTALLLQSTVFAQLKLLGVRPELMYLITIVIAIIEGPNEGAVTGFAAGLAQDFLLNQPKGITALTLTLVGYAAGLARQYIVSPSPLLPMILVGVGTAAGVTFYQVVAFLLGQLQETFTFAIRVTLLSALYGAILTPIVYPLLRRVIEGSRPTRVVRF
ncbi:MAG: rod shape-determining protein MreD [Actinomycetota bacterium]|nr:rod shape-determining protein MreD [Actinomycetota bacterium]MDH5225455.1 rod shape-determining protein MreD [Actinomycetota bacterium]MDH5313283.1 rod shape-determining protein MreD [Actinomycetota bacterium]